MLDLGFYVFYALLILAVLLVIVFPIIHMLREPASLLRAGIVLGIVIVLFVLSYALSDSAVSMRAAAAGITPSASKLIGAGLVMFYITLVLSALALLYSEISKALK
jgi:hypothetical protein